MYWERYVIKKWYPFSVLPSASLSSGAHTWSVIKVQAATENAKTTCMSKGWKLYHNKRGEEVKLRHVFEKISVWIRGLVRVVDIGMSADQSSCAALPWALIKILITVCKCRPKTQSN